MHMLARVEELKNAYSYSVATVKEYDELDLGRDELIILRCALVESVHSILLAYEKA